MLAHGDRVGAATSSYGTPIVHDPAGLGKPENQGFDAFIPLIDSGISLYVWSKPKFFAAVLFTCKRFEVARALDFTRTHFGAAEVEHPNSVLDLRSARLDLRPLTTAHRDAALALWRQPGVRRYLWDDRIIAPEQASPRCG